MADDIAMNITSKIVALSSAVAFALQIALALLMLRYFSPEEVGMFSVISQIGFFWTTLALAQAPLQLLANQGESVFADVRQAWFSSFQRFVWLLPATVVAVWWSGLPFVSSLLWTLLMSLCQFTWLLSLSMRLRITGTWSHFFVRVLPPFISLLVACFAVYTQWNIPALLLAALIGYAIGALSIAPEFFTKIHINLNPTINNHSKKTLTISELHDNALSTPPPAPSDTRPYWLRMGHSLADALLSAALLVVWQRSFGPQETGWLAAPLRVMGIIPAVIHMAWVQVLIAQNKQSPVNPTFVGLAGFSCVAIIGGSCLLALNFGWLGHDWQGIETYIGMLVLWQGSACMTAAYSHHPFQTKQSVNYSYACIVISVIQIFTLLIPFIFNYKLTSQIFFYLFSVVSIIGCLILYKRIK